MPTPTLRDADTDDYPAGLHLMDTADETVERSEYTRRHREAWPVMVRGPEAESLVPAELTSWLRLWGRLGAELFQCFRDGDAHIRTDMIALSRAAGWRGEVIADRLDVWRRQLLDA